MGRIQKKKDPVKKKAQREDKNSLSAAGSSNGSPVVSVKSITMRKKTGNQTKPRAAASEKNIPAKVMQFLREVKVELKKVTWPTRKQTIGSTAVTIVLVMIISAFLGVVDFGLSKMIQVLLP